MMNMQLHKQHASAAGMAASSSTMIAASQQYQQQNQQQPAHFQQQHQHIKMPSPQSQKLKMMAPYSDNQDSNNLTNFQQQHKKGKHVQYPVADGLQHQAHEGSAGLSIKMTSTMGNANESFEEISAISAFQVAQMNVIGGGGSGEEAYDALKKSKISKGKGGSIIVMNQHDQMVNPPPPAIKTIKKTTASQNKFDIKTIVAQAQDGAPSRKTQSHDRGHPSNNSAAPILGNAGTATNNMLMMVANNGQAHPLISSQSNERKPNKTAGTQYYASQQQQPVQVLQQNAQGNLFASFFSQPKEHYEFLTKTLGLPPHDPQNPPQMLKPTPQSTCKPKKSTAQGGGSDTVNNSISIIKKDSIINLKQHIDSSQSNVQRGQLSNSKFNNQQKKQQQTPVIYKSFQQPLVSGLGKPTSNQKLMLMTATTNSNNAGSQGGDQSQFMNNTLQTFTQNYYGAQHKKKQALQKKVTTQGQHRREQSENQQILKSSQTQLQQSKTVVVAPEASNSSRQLRFGQIMDELEKFSINNQHVSGEIAMHDLIAEEGWAVESHGGTTTMNQSSICESDLEYTQLGNIRASTYKRTVENQEARKRLKKYKSEERKREPSFFTKEYMDNRYVNDRVEMELKDFKAEIEKKFEGSKLRDFKYPRIVIKAASSTSRPNRQIKALAPNHHPYLYQNQHQSRGHSVEEADPSSSSLQNQRITLGGKNVIFKTTTTTNQQNHASKPSNSQVKHKNISILDELPVEMIKTQDMRQQQQVIYATGAKGDMLSFNDSMNEIHQQQQHQLTQDSIHFIESKKHNQHQHSNSHGPQKQPVNVLLQNFFVKQSFDNRTGTKPNQQLQAPLTANMTQSTTKKSNKLVNNSQDSIGQHHFNTFDAHEQNRSKGNQTVLLNKLNNERQQENQQKGATIQTQKQTPKNYSLQLNQVVKKILNDSGTADAHAAASVTLHQQPAKSGGFNSTSFDTHMLYEPSFYTTESYKQGHKKQMGSNDRSGHPLQQDHHNPIDPQQQQLLQTYMTNDQQQQQHQAIKRVTQQPVLSAKQNKSSLKVKQRSDSNGSSGQQKNTLLNKIYRSSKGAGGVKSPQSRQQSNMNLNNQNAMIIAQPGRAGEILRIAKPSHTVNQTNVNSTLSSVRQLHILSKQAPISHSRQGSSGMRQQPQAKSTGKTSTSNAGLTANTRLPSSSKKHHHNLSHVPSQHQQQLIGSNAVMFQTDTGASFHNYPNQNSNRNSSKDKKQQQIMIKSSQIKRTSGEKSNREAKESKGHSQKGMLEQQFAMMQRSFHNQQQQPQTLNSNNIQNLIISKQNMVAAQISSTGMKGSVASSPTQKSQHKKNQSSLTTKNTQRSVIQSQGKLVNLGILGQISNPQTNGKGGKITYRNNYPRINTNTNSNSQLVGGDLNIRLIPHASNTTLLVQGTGPTTTTNGIQNNYLTMASATGQSTMHHKNSNSMYYQQPERLPSQGDVSAYDAGGAYHSIDIQQHLQQHQYAKKGSAITSGSVDTTKMKKGGANNNQQLI